MLGQPGVSLDLGQTQPVAGLSGQYLADEILQLGGQMRRVVNLHRTDPIVGSFLVVWDLEGCFASRQLIAQHTQTPDVHSLVVQIALNDLRWDVIQRPTEGLP